MNVEEVLALTADFAAQEAAGQAWLLAFEDAQDALRFCLSCCIELTYSPWEGYDAWRGGSSATTPDGAALWNGPPVGFTVHSVTRGGARSGDAGAGPELRCTRSLKGREETFRGDVGAGLLEALVAARVLRSNARVVLTGPAWARLNEGLGGQSALSGKAVVEHLGRALVPCLSRPLEAYQVLPVQLAARAGSFVSLRDAAPGRLTLLAPGARDAPRPTAHLTFMFTAWFAPSDRDLLELARRGPAGGGGGDRIGVGSGRLAAELQRVRRDCHSEMQAACVEYDGYVVEEIGPCEFLLAFPSAVSAASFACAVQVGLHAAFRASSLLEGAGLGAVRPLAPSGPSAFRAAGAAGVEPPPGARWPPGLPLRPGPGCGRSGWRRELRLHESDAQSVQNERGLRVDVGPRRGREGGPALLPSRGDGAEPLRCSAERAKEQEESPLCLADGARRQVRVRQEGQEEVRPVPFRGGDGTRRRERRELRGSAGRGG